MIIRNAICTILLALFLQLVVCSVVNGQAVDQMQKSAETLASTIRKAGVKKIAVVPLLFVEDRGAEQKARENAEFDSDIKIERARPILSASLDSLRLAEQMQDFLSQAGQGDFGIVPAEDLLERLNEAKNNTEYLKPSSKDLAAILNPEGDIDALVVGTIRKKFAEINHLNGGTILGPEQVGYDWQVLDLSKRTILVSALNEPNYGSLAEAVYNGLSLEYFRYQNGRLTCLLDYQPKDRKDIPLRPSEPEALFNDGYIFSSRVHPLLNPNCPLKVQYGVADRILPVQFAAFEGFDGPQVLPHAVINLEPGDEPVIRVSNTLSKRVIVAVFVDGINILGKKRFLMSHVMHGFLNRMRR